MGIADQARSRDDQACLGTQWKGDADPLARPQTLIAIFNLVIKMDRRGQGITCRGRGHRLGNPDFDAGRVGQAADPRGAIDASRSRSPTYTETLTQSGSISATSKRIAPAATCWST